MHYKLLIIIIACFFNSAYSQNDSVFIRQIYNEALSNGESYENLRSLCKDIGARLTGSAEAEMAVNWGEQKMNSYNFDKVYKLPVKVPHWERGTKEAGWIKTNKGEYLKVNLLALGGSIGTNGMIDEEVIMFSTLDELKNADATKINGKIVFINQHMDEKQIQTFRAYGGCYAIRGYGAVEASKKGAIAVIIRSLAIPQDDHPHTGTMSYSDDVQKIPAAALSTNASNKLADILNSSSAHFVLEMDCRDYPDVISYNVVAEITGSENANNIITFGGHLDSWDTGEGAHDDGAGIAHTLEALRILKELGYKPKNTLRLVFFMNEENGNRGGMDYAKWAKEQEQENHILALESDRGGFAPRGFSMDGDREQLKLLASFKPLFKTYDLHIFDKGHSGVDIGPLKEQFKNIPLVGFVPDSQRYFDFHHSPNDVFENVNRRELELGSAAIASILYLFDENL